MRTKVISVLAIAALSGVWVLLSPISALARVAGPRPVARLELRDLSGKSRSIQELRGKVVLVNFWATWCGPCVNELPVLAELAERYRADGLVIVAASVDEPATRGAVEDFARKRGKGLEVWIGADNADMAALGLDGDSVPATVLLDRSGGIAKRMQGGVSRGELDPVIEKLLKEAGGSPDSPEEQPRSPHRPHARPGLPEAAAPLQSAGRSL